MRARYRSGGGGGGKKGINGEAKGTELTGAEAGSYIRTRTRGGACRPVIFPTKDTLRLCHCVPDVFSDSAFPSFLFDAADRRTRGSIYASRPSWPDRSGHRRRKSAVISPLIANRR